MDDFQIIGDLGNKTFVDVAISATSMYIAAVASNHIYISSNFGDTFVIAESILATSKWGAIAMSSSGEYISAGVRSSTGSLYISNDFGASFQVYNDKNIEDFFYSIDISSTGIYQVAVGYSDNDKYFGGIYYSFGFGRDWGYDAGYASVNYVGVKVSDDGKYFLAAGYNDHYYTSSNWIETEGNKLTVSSTIGFYSSVAMSSDGKYQVISSSSGYTQSSNYGSTFTLSQDKSNIASISMDGTGAYIYYVTVNGGIFISSNFASSFALSTTAPSNANWISISVAKSGYAVVAAVLDGLLYKSLAFVANNPSETPTSINSYSPTIPTDISVIPTNLGSNEFPKPSIQNSDLVSDSPISVSSISPTSYPSMAYTFNPTFSPTFYPTKYPTQLDSMFRPTVSPSNIDNALDSKIEEQSSDTNVSKYYEIILPIAVVVIFSFIYFVVKEQLRKVPNRDESTKLSTGNDYY